MLYENNFSAQDWSVLCYVPLWVFQEVAKADGTVSIRERNSLLNEINLNEAYKSGLAKEILAVLMHNWSTVIEKFNSQPKTYQQGLTKACEILNNFSDQKEVALFKTSMFIIGIKIAKASGERVNLFDDWRNIDELEKETLREIANLLELDSNTVRRILEGHD